MEEAKKLVELLQYLIADLETPEPPELTDEELDAYYRNWEGL
jgi:hypothetical protein